MNLSNNAQATLLLTSYFSKASKESIKPLSNSEWGRFALWLKENGLKPEDFLKENTEQLLSSWIDKKITIDRLLSLLGRGHSLALATDKWSRAGIWILTRSDPEYPWRLKKRLQKNSPPVLFGCGNKELLSLGGISVVGSRNAPAQDLLFTEQFGAKAASNNINIVSGASRGVDEAAMLGAMNAGGNVVGVLSEDLLRTATSRKWRDGLMQGNAVLLSPFYPEAGFSAGNAMGRNKYIYCLSDASLVIHSGTKGGTWSGARENIKKRWVPLWIKPTKDLEAGNEALVTEGAQWCSGNLDELKLDSLFTQVLSVSPQNDMFPIGESVNNSAVSAQKESIPPMQVNQPSIDFYALFIQNMQGVAKEPISDLDISLRLGLHKTQVTEWLKRAMAEGSVVKLASPVRFQWNEKFGVVEE